MQQPSAEVNSQAGRDGGAGRPESARADAVNFTRLVLGGGGRPDYLQKLKVPEGCGCIEAKFCK